MVAAHEPVEEPQGVQAQELVVVPSVVLTPAARAAARAAAQEAAREAAQAAASCVGAWALEAGWGVEPLVAVVPLVVEAPLVAVACCRNNHSSHAA